MLSTTLALAFAFIAPPSTATDPSTTPFESADAATGPTNTSASTNDPAIARKRLAANVATWNKQRLLTVRAGPMRLTTEQFVDVVYDSTLQSESFPYASLSYNHPLHTRFVLGGAIGITRWELANAESTGYGQFWAMDLVVEPKLRLPFGRRGRTGLLLGMPAGLTLDVAPTPDKLLAVREEAGLGVGWNLGLDLGYYIFISPRIGLQLATFGGIQRLRHNWRFTTADGTLDAHRQIVRYQSRRLGATLGVVVAF